MADRKDRNRIQSPQTSCLFPEWEGKWTKWKTAMKPKDDADQRFESRKGTGFRLDEKYLREFLGQRDDGVYEWKISKPNKPAKIVYAGKTSSARNDSLFGRLTCYCRDGSHESSNIDQALKEGYKIKVRVLAAEDVGEKANDMEKRMLERYSYDWNDMQN